MLTLEKQIIELHNQGAGVEEISQSMGLDVVAIEACLLKYKKLQEEDIPDEDFVLIRKGLIETAKDDGVDVSVRTKAQMYLWDRKRGAIKTQAPPSGVTVIQINESLKQVRPRFDELVAKITGTSNQTEQVLLEVNTAK